MTIAKRFNIQLTKDGEDPVASQVTQQSLLLYIVQHLDVGDKIVIIRRG